DSIFYSIRRLSKDTVMWGVFGGTVLGLFLILYSPLCRYLKLAPLSAAQLITVLAVSAASVLWYEVVKLVKRGTKK
ncbi:MAG: cation transporting ATPase C-terminal domain-containing protein, partial [Bacillota bacterium]|nr:cation transporting ATPase C-terminal domain-containing protein [Bacillota bacterium]